MKNTYLYQLFSYSKPAFVAVVLFIIGQLFFTYKGVETFPFLNYGMYSAYYPPKDTFTTYSIFVDNTAIKISDQYDLTATILQSTLNRYAFLKENNYKDPLEKVIEKRFKNRLSPEQYSCMVDRLTNNETELKEYPKWLLDYIADYRLMNENKLTVLKNKTVYRSDAVANIAADTLIYFSYDK